MATWRSLRPAGSTFGMLASFVNGAVLTVDGGVTALDPGTVALDYGLECRDGGC